MALLLLAVLFLLPQKAPASTLQEMILPVAVNTTRKGDYLLLLDPAGKVLIPREDFASLGLLTDPPTVERNGRRYVPLETLDPGLRYDLDERDMTLRIDAPPELLGESNIDLRSGSALPSAAAVPAFFLNYEALYSAVPGRMPSSPDVVAEAGLGTRGAVALTTFSRSALDGRIVRLSSSVVRDDPASLRRLVVGDFTAFSGPLGSQPLMGGITLSKNFALDPYSLQYPTPTLSGAVSTPSEIEIYQNGLLIGRRRVAPGKFLLENIPGAATGLGEFDVRIRDAFGREQQIVSPYYFTDNLLRKGIHEYSYSIGFTREAIGLESFGYRRPAALAHHGYGISDSLTLGFAGEASVDRGGPGPTATLLLGRAGELSLAASASLASEGAGLGGFLSHRFISRFVSTSVSFRTFTAEYASVSTAVAIPKAELGLAASFDAFGAGSLTAGYVLQRGHGDDRTDRPSLSFSRALNGSSNLFVTASTSRQSGMQAFGTAPGAVNAIFAGLQVYLGKDVSGDVGHSLRNGQSAGTVRLHKRAPGIHEGQGFGYEAALARAASGGDGVTDGSGIVQYNGPVGVYRAEYRRDSFGDVADVSVAGSVVAVGRSLHLNRPVSESFALVRTSGLGGVPVTVDNRRIGKTNSRGEILVPGLLAYQPNRVSIEGRDVPLRYAVDSTERNVVPRYRSGTVVDFTIRKTQAFYGSLFDRRGEAWSPAGIGRLRLEKAGRRLEVPIGTGGEFYLENVTPGTYRAEAAFPDHDCGFELVIPEKDEVLVSLGEVYCGREQG